MKFTKQGTTTTCLIDYNLTIDNETAFKNELLGNLDDSVKKMVLDMSQVTFIDSSALGTLVYLNNDLQKKGISLALKSLTEPVQDIMDVGSFDLILKIE